MKLVLAGDHRLLLLGLANLLETHGIEPVGMAHDGSEAIELAHAHHPALILMDLVMPHCDGLAATRFIQADLPEIQVLILADSDNDPGLFDAVRSGACGYLLRGVAATDLMEALKQAAQGIPPSWPGLAACLLDELARPGAPSPHLTDWQRQVLELMAQGHTYGEIGIHLGLSERTVQYHMAVILQDLHLKHRFQVLAYAARPRPAPTL